MNNVKFSFKDIKKILPANAEVIGDKKLVEFANVASIENVDENSLDWINSSNKNKKEFIQKTKARVVICDKSIEFTTEEFSNKCIIRVDDPKLVFARIVNGLFVERDMSGIHETAFVSEKAKIGENVTIGAFTVLSECEIGDNTIICDNCSIKNGVKIGKNVFIDSNTVIGSEGFGYVRNETGHFEKFPHISSVIIKDDVEIGANTTIDRGSLKPTIIEKGVKIDNLVHIAHNVHIRSHSAIIANAMIAGSTEIGKKCWIAPSSSILEHLKIGDNVTIGVGAVVTKDVPDGEVWTGSPARPLKDFVKIQKKLKKDL